MAEAELLCDRIAIIKSGKLIALDSPQKLREKFEMPLSFELEFSDSSLFEQFRQISNSISSVSALNMKIQIPKSVLPQFLSLLSKNPSKIISLKSTEDPFDDVFLNILKR
jgi:ABC-2 type transport system ATP-binding protein